MQPLQRGGEALALSVGTVMPLLSVQGAQKGGHGVERSGCPFK